LNLLDSYHPKPELSNQQDCKNHRPM